MTVIFKVEGLLRLLALFLLTSIVAGCGVGLPTKPTVEIKQRQPALFDINAVVSLGQRRLLKEISNEITKIYHDIQIVDGLLFRDTAFPEGGWVFADLLEPGVIRNIGDQLNIDYLVLLGEIKSSEEEVKGFFLPLVAGAMSGEGSFSLSAIIMDLKTEKLVTMLECETHGTTHILYYVIIAVGNEPTYASTTIESLAKEIGKVLTELDPLGKKRVAVLGLETPSDDTEMQEIVENPAIKQYREWLNSMDYKSLTYEYKYMLENPDPSEAFDKKKLISEELKKRNKLDDI